MKKNKSRAVDLIYAEVILLNMAGIADKEIGARIVKKCTERNVSRHKKAIMDIYCREGFRDMSVVVEKVTSSGFIHTLLELFKDRHPDAVAAISRKFTHTKKEENGKTVFYVCEAEEQVKGN
ncbi:MAG: hypothetical protein HY063_03865 [Bacteroidetes bacterium]|nr:hypothetical protein [Bacteroidota bacterium]